MPLAMLVLQFNTEWVGPLVQPLGVVGLAILLLHPIPLSFLVFLLLFWFLKRTGLWSKYNWIIAPGIAALYLIDAAIALPRIAYTWRLSDRPVIHQKVPMPATLVQVNGRCEIECHRRLISGEIDTFIVVSSTWLQTGSGRPPQSFRAGWSLPGHCPPERSRATDFSAYKLVANGYCPLVERTDVPAEGIFVVQETHWVSEEQLARPITSTQLVEKPPGRTIEFKAIEVQRRMQGRVELLAAQRYYAAPGLMGLPLLVGCWTRGADGLASIPFGDSGCGLWRLFTAGGDRRTSVDHITWVYTDVLAAPDRPITRSQPPETP